MSNFVAPLTTEEKRLLLRERLAGGRRLPKTYPASYSQRRLWFMHRLAPESPAYNVEAALPLGAIDGEILERAINAIVARHEALRTTFVEVDGEPIQRIAPELHVPLERISLAGQARGTQESKLAAIRRDCATEPFNLARGPLVRTRLVNLGPSRNMFLLHLHHILADGWSMGIFSHELTALYAAFGAGNPSPLVALPLQYGDFSLWQRRAGDGEGFAAETAYWLDKLSDMMPLDLPTDRARPAVQSFSGAFHNFAFSADLSERVEAFSREQGVTEFMTLLTAFKVVLVRMADQEDIAIGTYIANRDRAEVEGLIGFFLNTLVLRTHITRSASFADALQAVKETAVGAYSNQSLPFERLVELLSPPRDLGRNPLVQVVFQLQNAVADEPGGGSALIDYQRSAAAFDLALTAYRKDRLLHFTCEYATDLFDEYTVAAMAMRLEQVLREAMQSPRTEVGALNILLPEERRRLAQSLAPPMADNIPVTQIFAAAVEAEPDAPAFYMGAACATLGQVASCASRIAHALTARGIGKGDVVAVCLPRSVELAASLQAVWQAGAIYLPLDPAFPPPRLQFMLEDSAAGLAIVNRATGASLPQSLARIDVNDAIGDLSRPVPDFVPTALEPGDASHIIYTSGSTGRPKGALSPHRQVSARLGWMWQQFPHGPNEVEAVKTATSFIDSLWELTGPMIARRPASIVDAEILLEPAALVAQLARDGVTRMWVTPSYLRLLLEAVPDLGAKLPLLTCWFVTGEKLTGELVRTFAAACPEARLVNLYGTSEAWDICCAPDLSGQEAGETLPIGFPLEQCGVVVLDSTGAPAPDGVPGELHVSGAMPCLGFVKRPDLDAVRFVDLLGPDGNVRLLSTGDRVRRRADGQFEMLGRLDDELKISGVRVHPAEVEACLAAVDGVASAAATGVTASDGTTRLWAWFVPAGDETEDIVTIRARLSEMLPAAFLPERLLAVDRLPTTPSGKVDRRALAAQALLSAAEARPELDRETDGESENIAAIFSEVLDHPVGVEENFFSAGGHSLLAARALTRINDRLSLDLGIRDIFLDPTAAGLARRAVKVTPGAPSSAIRRLPRRVEAQRSERDAGGAA